MHPRNQYRYPPNFAELADSYEALRPCIFDNRIDFQNAVSQRRLTEAIMFRDFGIQLQIPSNRLCPPVPNRLNYVLWIQDIIHAHDSVLKPRPRTVRGLDIGTGASVIYPFLMCKVEPGCEMVATELDEESFSCARENIFVNKFELQISLRRASANGRIFFALEDDDHFEFTMCNPPFYRSAQEVADLAKRKELPPNAVCTGADIEMVYRDGGEAGFVARMVRESEEFQTKCKWYTSMLGRISSVLSIIELFRERSIANYAITEFVQGQTRRWAVAWTFTDTHLPDSIARISSIPTNHALHPVLPPRNTLVQRFSGCTFVGLYDLLVDVLRSLEPDGVSATEIDPLGPFFIQAQSNTWSRSARRGRRKQSEVDSNIRNSTSTVTATHPALTCSARVIGQDGACSFSVEFQWICGRDRPLFDSFAGHVSRKVGTGLRDKVQSPVYQL